ncbi:hypothetical protein Tco_0481240 [Tanacetum coccineum]
MEPLPPLPKISGAKPIGTSADVITLADLTQTPAVSKEIRKILDKKSVIKAPKKKAQTVSPSVPDPIPIKIADSSTKQLILTLMKEVKGLKEQIKTPSNNFASVSQTQSSKAIKGKQKTWFASCKHCGFRNHLPEDCYMKPKCFTCGSTEHLTKEHPEQVAVKKTLAKLKAQSSQGSSSRKAPIILNPFIDCKYFGFNDHHSDECEYYPKCDICGSIAHETIDCTKKPSSNNRKPRIDNISIIVKRHGKTAYDVFRGRSPDISYFHVFGCPVHIHNHKDHLGKFDEKADDGFFLGYSLVAKSFREFNIRRQEIEETYHVIFSEDDEAISKSSTTVDDYFRYVPAYGPLSINNITIPDYVTPIPLNINSPDESHEFTIVDDYPIRNEPGDFESTDNLESAKVQDSIINEPISEAEPSPTIISPSAEISINPHIPQDRWSREKHIDLVNIIGEPLASVTTRSRIRDSEVASAHECLYVNFLSEIETKKLIEAFEDE